VAVPNYLPLPSEREADVSLAGKKRGLVVAMKILVVGILEEVGAALCSEGDWDSTIRVAFCACFRQKRCKPHQMPPDIPCRHTPVDSQ
jgi:hypothetical protein